MCCGTTPENFIWADGRKVGRRAEKAAEESRWFPTVIIPLSRLYL